MLVLTGGVARAAYGTSGSAFSLEHLSILILRRIGFTVPHGLKTWQTLLVRKGSSLLRITALLARHSPGPLAKLLPEVMGTMLEFQPAPNKTALRLYISGDTLLFFSQAPLFPRSLLAHCML